MARRCESWVDAIASEIKERAPQQLVGVGDEGFDQFDRPGYDAAFWQDALPKHLLEDGASFLLNTASPHVDYGSVHLYPELWGVDSGDAPRVGAQWIAEHAQISHGLGKPLLITELGLVNEGGLNLSERRAVYRGWLTCAQRSGAAVVSPWLFAHDDRPEHWDPFTFYLKDGSDPADPVNRYADILIDFSGPHN